MSTGQGVISSNDLMKKLVQAKKVMNKVETGDFERGNVNEDIIRSNPEELVLNENLPQSSPVRPVGTPDIDKIKSSKLPDAIKKAMIENPIPQIKLNEGLDMDFVKGAKRLMEQEGLVSKPPKKQIQQPQRQQEYQPRQVTHVTEGVDMNALTILIENTIRKVLDEKLNQILTAQQTTSINENLVLKVGDSIFKGKITGVNKAN